MPSPKTRILHVCARGHLLPLRDEALRASGYEVDSVSDSQAALSAICSKTFDLALIDVATNVQISNAESLCEHMRKAQPEILVAFACNWQVSIHSQCPDDVVRTEFNPDAFVRGVRSVLKPN